MEDEEEMKVARLKEILDSYEARYPGIEVLLPLPGNYEQVSMNPSIMLGIASFSKAYGDKFDAEAAFIVIRPLVEDRYIVNLPGTAAQDVPHQNVYPGQDPSILGKKDG